jgi:Endoglucanase
MRHFTDKGGECALEKYMPMKILLLSMSFLCVALVAAAGENGVSVHGALKVVGTKLVNTHGVPVQLRGMSSHGLHWYPEYTNITALLDLKKLGANVFRAAMYADSNKGGYNDGEANMGLNKRLLRLAVENTIAADMYAIIDWHILEDKNPMNTVDSAEAFFEEMSSLYAGHEGIIYEICNEPNGETTWADIALYAERIIPVIRKNDPGAVILVGTPHYSSRILDVLEAPLAYDNLMYSFHYYTGFTDYIPMEALDKAKEAGLPIFVSEWGMNEKENTETDIEKAENFIKYMQKNQLSWVNWSLCNKEEGFSAIKHEVLKINGWSGEDLTVSGQIIFRALGGADN